MYWWITKQVLESGRIGSFLHYWKWECMKSWKESQYLLITKATDCKFARLSLWRVFKTIKSVLIWILWWSESQWNCPALPGPVITAHELCLPVLLLYLQISLNTTKLSQIILSYFYSFFLTSFFWYRFVKCQLPPRSYRATKQAEILMLM